MFQVLLPFLFRKSVDKIIGKFSKVTGQLQDAVDHHQSQADFHATEAAKAVKVLQGFKNLLGF